MSIFVEKPNLPHNANEVILGEKYAEILDFSLKNLGIEPIYVPDNSYVDERLSGHSDLSVFHAGGEKWFLSGYLNGTQFARKLQKLNCKIEFYIQPQRKEYPWDAALNCCLVGKNLIYSRGITAQQIVDYFTISDYYNLINSRQGYSRCSICVVDENSIITADAGIAKAAKRAGIDVLLISQGYVNLLGFEYGFIGGSAFKLADNAIAFSGLLDRHPDRAAIFEFLGARHIEPVFLTSKTVFDVGGAMAITEK